MDNLKEKGEDFKDPKKSQEASSVEEPASIDPSEKWLVSIYLETDKYSVPKTHLCVL